MINSKYILELMDVKSPESNEMRLFLNECVSDSDAIIEAQAQLEMMSCYGGIPYDEQWSEIKGILMKEDDEIWTDSIVMEY